MLECFWGVTVPRLPSTPISPLTTLGIPSLLLEEPYSAHGTYTGTTTPHPMGRTQEKRPKDKEGSPQGRNC